MRIVVKKGFPYSDDGIRTRDVVKDEKFDCRDDIVQGLIDAGFVAPAAADAAEAEADTSGDGGAKIGETAAALAADAAEAEAVAARAAVADAAKKDRPAAEQKAVDLEAKARELRATADAELEALTAPKA